MNDTVVISEANLHIEDVQQLQLHLHLRSELQWHFAILHVAWL
jgi:hypothetical protein